MKRKALKVITASVGLALSMGAVAAVSAQVQIATEAADASSEDPDAQLVAGLAERFRTIIAGFSIDAPQQDIEAALVFEADQSGLPQAVITAALDQVLVGQRSRVASNALVLIAQSQRRAAGQGTGALSGTEALDFFGEDTGPPVVLGGGADSDYSL